MNVVVIGGGPAGILAAIAAKEEGNEVIILEKMSILGKKLLITGKGRCNITSSIPIEDFIKNIPGNGMFLYSAFNKYTNNDIIELLKQEGLQVKEERGNRIFPITDKSVDVQKAFLQKLKKLNVKIETNAKVQEIKIKENKVTGVIYIKNEEEKEIKADKIILATGGKSYPGTGSTGDGYKIAEKLGHTIITPKASLVPLTANEKIQVNANLTRKFKNSLQICKELQGLSLRNVKIQIKDTKNNKIIYEDFGEMLFTHFGVSGPTVLSGSAHLLRYKNVDELLKNGEIKLVIDLKPALNLEKLDLRVLRDFETEKNKAFKNSLEKLLPKKLINPVIELCGISPEKKVNEITKQERIKLVNLLKNFEIVLRGFRPIEEAIITSGGISIKEINPKTMESKIISGLHFAGEVIDVDAYTGGFNLQIAYSTGYVAGKSM